MRRTLRTLASAFLAALLVMEQGSFACARAAEILKAPLEGPALVELPAVSALPAALAPQGVPGVPASAVPAILPHAPSPLEGAAALAAAGRQPEAAKDPVQAEAAAVQAFDGGKKLDPFGRDIGWDQMPAEPADAPSSIEQASLEPLPGKSYSPSPEDWRDEIFYSVIIDRFARKAPFTAWGDPADGRTRHGGNIRGLIDKLDYLQGLGVTTLLISPIVMSPPSGSHQYWALHFLAVDPQLGTKAEIQELVRQAHARGMRVVLDMVFNHTGPVAEYEGGFHFGPPKKIEKWNYPIKPVELAKEEHFSRRGDINNWDDPEQIKHGDLPGGINHLDTDNPATQDILLKVAKYWINELDIDGFRLDVYKHVSPAFWKRFFPEVRMYAESLGKKNFLLVGELYDGNPANLVPEVAQGRLSSAYNYPAYYWDFAALHGEAATRSLENNFHALKSTLGKSLDFLVHFLDNHDRPHFLRAADPEGLLRFAAAYTLLSVGIPYIYYGTEQAFRQVPEREKLDLEASRDDMFTEGGFKNPATPEGGFNPQSLLYRLMSAIAAVRKAYPALRRGEQFVRWSDPRGPGIFAFSRIDAEQEVVVVLNSANAPRSAQMWVDAERTPGGAQLRDALQPEYVVQAQGQENGGSKIAVDVPAYGVRILVRER